MRSKRLRKHRTRFHLLLFIGKVLMVWYLAVFSVSYLTSNTTANFTDKESASGVIYAGNWVSKDESTLKFTDKPEDIVACEPIIIKTEIKNEGPGDMQSESTYDVYYDENGNSEKEEKMDLPESEGTIKELKAEETAELIFKASNPGSYTFVVYQLNEDRDETRSKEIQISCDSGQSPTTAETTDNEDSSTTNNETQPPESEETSNEENAANEEENAVEVEDSETNNEEETETDEGATDNNDATSVEEGEDGEK